MQAGATQIRQSRPATQGAVRATMNARPITGQQPTTAQRVAGKCHILCHKISTLGKLFKKNIFYGCTAHA